MCSGGDDGTYATVEVATLWDCQSSVGGYAGVFDLSGNVWEWEDSCDEYTDSMNSCRARGGAFYSAADFLRCDSDGNTDRGFVDYSIGFRCCTP